MADGVHSSYQPAPFFVLDEVDAALDNTNVAKVANYIRSQASDDFQFIVISLKGTLYERGNSLVGIYRDQEVNSSRTLTLDVSPVVVLSLPCANSDIASSRNMTSNCIAIFIIFLVVFLRCASRLYPYHVALIAIEPYTVINMDEESMNGRRKEGCSNSMSNYTRCQ